MWRNRSEEGKGLNGLRAGSDGSLTGTQLKWIALVTMLIDHVGLVLAGPDSFWYWPMRLIGRLAFPLYCFLLVEGFCHTGSVNRYLMRLGIFALVSEIPYDLMKGRISGSSSLEVLFQGQNVYFTLFLGLLALKGYVYLQNRGKLWQSVAWCAGMAGLAFFLRTDYDWAGVVLICFLYRFRQEPMKRALFGYATLMLGVDPSEVTALVSFLLMDRYRGERGSSRFRWGFYVFYPVHLVLLWLVSKVISL